ncbi:MAG TPA: hypothetical protein VK153_02330 [Candidatus Paceibacterota bacterium]|nr:hypothetical protein [Candidatus Paceibacterota bacterium]
MNTSDKCGACGTPKSKNRFREDDCPHCYPENFVGIKIPIKKEVVVRPIADIVDENIPLDHVHVEDIGNESLQTC